MHLKSLHIKGFKSFARATSIIFHPGFSVIVGPNGTGKSNIVDAILWVLGEQNPRFLRGQSMNDIIFSGTEKLPPSPYAEVTLVFDNSNLELPLEASEVSIKRLLERDGTSSYFINEKPCRLLDIREILSQLGLGQELPGIVPQNRIYDLIRPSSNELKAIIEEASGIGYYRARKNAAVRRLLSADNKLEQIKLLYSEVSKQLNILKKQVDDYYRISELKNELKELKIKKIVFNLLGFKSRFLELSGEIELLQAELNSIKERIESLQKDQELLEQSRKNNRDAYRSIEEFQKIKEFENNFNYLLMVIEEKGRNRLDKLSGLRNQISSIIVNIKNKSSELKGLEEKLDHTAQRISELREESKLLLQEKNSLASQLNDNAAVYKDLREKLKFEESEIFRFEREIYRLESEISLLKKQRDENISVKERNSEKISNLSSEFEEEKSKLDIDLPQFSILKSEVNELQQKYADTGEEIRLLLSEKNQLKSELSNVENDIEELKRSLHGATNPDFTRIEDLVEIDKELVEILNSIFPHSGSLYVVTQDELKNADRNTLPDLFILAEKDRKEAALEFIKTLKAEMTENQKRPTLSQAGFSLHPAGFYYRTVSESGYYARLERLNELYRKAESLRIRLESIEKLIEEKRAAENELRAKIDEIKGRARNLEDIIERRKKRIKNLENEISFLKFESEQIEKRLKSSEEEIEKKQPMLTALSEEKAGKEKTLNGLRDQIARLSRSKSELESKLTQLNDSIRKKYSEIDVLNEKEKSLKKDIERIDAEIREYRNLLKTLNEASNLTEAAVGKIKELHFLLSAYKDVINLLIAANAEIYDLQKNIEKYTEEMRRISNEMSSLYEREVKIASRLGILKEQLAETERKIEESVEELESLTQSPVDFILEKYSDADIDIKEVERKIGQIEKKLENSGGYNPFAVRDYETLKERAENLRKQSQDIKDAIKNINQIIEVVDEKIRDTFKAKIKELNSNFDSIFSLFFNGGHAQISTLELEDGEDELAIEIELPGKKMRNVNLLSGGEKSIAALALILSLEETFKIPFLILDEVEPALDELNLRRIINYIKDVSKKSQIIMISHQPLTVEMADVIYGVTVDNDGSSRVYSLKLAEEVLDDNRP